MTVRVLILTSTDFVAAAQSCVAASVTVLNRKGSRVRAETIDVEDLSSEALTESDVLVVTGGEPARLRRLMGGRGAGAIRSFVAGGGGYVGVCAGAVLAARKSPTLDLLPSVSCYDDNVWWASGLIGTARLRRTPNIDPSADGGGESAMPESLDRLAEFFVPDAASSLRPYYNGPLLVIDGGAHTRAKRRTKPTRREREEEEALRAVGGGTNSSLDQIREDRPVALAVFAGDVEPWAPDPDAPRPPERGQMDGRVAALVGRHGAGIVVLSSIHPEFDDVFEERSANGRLLEEMCVLAAQKSH